MDKQVVAYAGEFVVRDHSRKLVARVLEDLHAGDAPMIEQFCWVFDELPQPGDIVSHTDPDPYIRWVGDFGLDLRLASGWVSETR